MLAASRSNLASAWIDLQNASRASAAHGRLFWAHEKMADLVRNDPEESWLTVLEILKQNPSEWVVENLASGPVEDLLVAHGEQFIGRIEALVDMI